ncbi:UNVERIFIED_CONTAM: Bet1-like SNARE 1-1 [Sesamum calycinum]|uniref:Bet1-like SNARE 1-1 n=1 Tax=Sesamum calycinum TaxID=2727403 RepID=A0AAW2N2U9_9LAMI
MPFSYRVVIKLKGNFCNLSKLWEWLNFACDVDLEATFISWTFYQPPAPNIHVLKDIFGFRDRNARAALFDGIEEGGIRASPSYSSHEIDEQENDRAMDGLQDRVNLLKRLSGDIHEEVESHNLMLDRMGNDMDASRGVLSGTMDKFKMVVVTGMEIGGPVNSMEKECLSALVLNQIMIAMGRLPWLTKPVYKCWFCIL